MGKLIFGCGYLGIRVARRWRDAGHEVFVVTRNAERAKQFAAEGLRPIVADVLRPETLAELPACDTALYAIGYDRGAGATIHDVYAGGLQAVLDRLSDETAKVIYISSTGVYGQSGGETVDEESATEPMREGGRACLAAEKVLAAHRLAGRGIVLRLAGLYGPGRVPLADDIHRARPIAAPKQGLLNLIHVDDAASAVLAADERAEPPRTYVVSDGHPVERGEYYQELARLLGAPAPAFAPPSPGSPASRRAAADKRVNNARMLRELGVELAYPNYRLALAAIVSAQNAASGDT